MHGWCRPSLKRAKVILQIRIFQIIITAHFNHEVKFELRLKENKFPFKLLLKLENLRFKINLSNLKKKKMFASSEIQLFCWMLSSAGSWFYAHSLD